VTGNVSHISLGATIERTAIAPLLLDERRRAELVEEHRALMREPSRTRARWSPSSDLDRVLDHFRRADLAGKYVLIASPDRAGWIIGRLSGTRGEAPTLVDETLYSSRTDAEHEVFVRRIADFLSRYEPPPAGRPSE
jgi:hypothetical protein